VNAIETLRKIMVILLLENKDRNNNNTVRLTKNNAIVLDVQVTDNNK